MSTEKKENVAGMTDRQFRDFVIDQFDAGAERFDDLNDAIKENTTLTATVVKDTSELLEVFNSVKGGFKVLGWIGSFVKWAGAITVALGGVYAAWKKWFP